MAETSASQKAFSNIQIHIIHKHKFEHLLNIQGCITRMCGGEAKIRQSCVQETDSGRATLTDIFCNTSGFSAKTVQAIYKETLYKVGTIECSKF